MEKTSKELKRTQAGAVEMLALCLAAVGFLLFMAAGVANSSGIEAVLSGQQPDPTASLLRTLSLGMFAASGLLFILYFAILSPRYRFSG